MKKILLFILISFSFIHSQDSRYTKTEKYNCRDVRGPMYVSEVTKVIKAYKKMYGELPPQDLLDEVYRQHHYKKCDERQVPMTPEEIKKEKEKERIEAERIAEEKRIDAIRIAEEKRIAAIEKIEKQRVEYINSIWSSSVSVMMQYLNSPTKEKELSLYAYFEVFPIVFYNKIKDVKLTDDQTVKLVDSILSDNSEIEESVIFSTVLNKLSGRESIGAFKYENKEFRHIFGDENAVFLNKTNEFKDFSSLFLKYVYITMDDSKSSLLQSYRKSFNKAKNKPKGPLAYGGLARFFLKIRSDMYGMTGHKLKEEKSNKAFKKYTDLFKTAVIKNKANINYDLVD